MTTKTMQSPIVPILILSLAPTIGLGIGRFAYSLVLPDMRDALDWSYSAAGFMNTTNAAGYLIGALASALLARRYGLAALVKGGTVACIVSLLMCGITGNFAVLSFARFLTGFGAAFSFVAGGALAAALAQRDPPRASLNLSLFYCGPGTGILLSGLLAPLLLAMFGAGSWWIIWLALAAICAVVAIPLFAARFDDDATDDSDIPTAPFAVRPVLIYLIGYFLFGAGYIAYMTFMIAYVRDAGGGPLDQALFWSLIGLSSFVAPWVWRDLLAKGVSGRSTAIILMVNAIGAAMPLLGSSQWILCASAFVFGLAFFAVVTSTTAFVRFNYARDVWPGAIAAMTITFGIGQTLGPFTIGAIADATGSLGSSLMISAATLALGAGCCALQRPVKDLA